MTDTREHTIPVAEPREPGAMRAFIEAVLGEQHGNVVMATVGARLPNGKPVVNRPTWFSYPRDLPRMTAWAEDRVEEDVYLSPIVYGEERDAKGKLTRAKSNALTCQTIYMDSDACPPERFRLTPSIHVQTSEHHGQDYWVLTEPVSATRAAEIAHRITTAHKADGTDPSGWSSSKFLRLPTTNRSYAEPWPVTWQHTGEVYLDLDVEGAYDDVQVTIGPDVDEAAPPTTSAPAAGRRPALLEKTELAPLYARVPASNLRLVELLEHKPKSGDAGWRSEQRWGLLLELLRAGFTDQEAMSLAWHAAASGKWWDDPRGLEGLWLELVKARSQVVAERGTNIPAAERVAVVEQHGPKLLSTAERRSIADSDDFVERYVTWAATRVPVLNRPLHEVNAWTYLSVVWSEIAGVWKSTGTLPLNLYSITIAESSSGKSEAARLMNSCVGFVYPYESPLLPADTSRNALIENLLERDGAVALANSDEAEETLRTQRDAGWAQGVSQAWTEVYDGLVPQQGRRGKKEMQRADTQARVVMHLMGTPEGMYDLLDRSMFKTGYMVRHIWERGLHIPVTPDTIRLARPSEVHDDVTLTPRYWADAQWRARAGVAGWTAMELTDEAAVRMDEARWAVVDGLEGLGDHDIYRPMGRRMLDIMLKASAMVALSERHEAIMKPDVLVALRAVEHWLETAVSVVRSMAESAFSRACDEIEQFVAGKEGREADASRIYGLMKGLRPREVDEYLDSLVRQGRLEAIQPRAEGSRKYRLKGDFGGKP